MKAQYMRGRLDRLERKMQPPEQGKQFHVVRVPGSWTEDAPESEIEAARKAALAEYEAEHGPVRKNDDVIFIIQRITNGRRKEAAKGPQESV